MRHRIGLLVLVALAATVLASPASGIAGFGDVSSDDYWAEGVQWMVDHDITTGTGQGCFSPEDAVTRGQAAAFIWRMEGSPTPAARHRFGDVRAAWQQDAVSWMVQEGVTTGTSPTTYSPDASLTRGQLAALLHRLAGEPSADGHPFTDVRRSWQQTPVAWMVAHEITTGTSPRSFSPDDVVTRGQLATFFHRYKGAPDVAISPYSPACTGLPIGTTPPTTTGGPPTVPPPADCKVSATEPWSSVWFDIHYNGAASTCGRPEFEGTGRAFIVDRNHPSASDGNPGTAAAPWKTIVHAADVAGRGDIVYVKAGTYDDGSIESRTSGVIFTAYPGHERRAVIVDGGFRAIGASDLIIHGFSFRNISSNGIQVIGPDAENVVIANNHTYDTWNAGINLRGVVGSHADPGNFDNIRDVLVIGNLVQLGTNGGGGELITVGSGAVGIDVVANEVSIGDPNDTGGDEGISFKEGVRDSRIYGNDVHDLVDKGIIIDGGSASWDALVTDIEIFDNRLYNLPAPGMWVVTEGMGDVDGVFVHDNIAWNNDADGFLVYDHPDGKAAGGTVKNVVFSHNIAFNNGVHTGYGGFRVNYPTATGIVFRNNIGWANTGADLRGDPGTVFDNNLCRNAVCEINSNPLFINAPSNFGLSAGSPAIDAATDGSDLGVR